MTALLRNEVSVLIVDKSLVDAHVKDGTVRIIAAASAKRPTAFPNLPTVAETVPGFSTGTYWALFGPAKLPPAVVDKIRADVSAIIEGPEARKLFETSTLEPMNMAPPNSPPSSAAITSSRARSSSWWARANDGRARRRRVPPSVRNASAARYAWRRFALAHASIRTSSATSTRSQDRNEPFAGIDARSTLARANAFIRDRRTARRHGWRPVRGVAAIPRIADAANRLGNSLRLEGRLDRRLFELAILVIARHWSAQYEWFVHEKTALDAGLGREVVEAVRHRQVPRFARSDEQLVYDVVTEMHETRTLGQASFDRALAALGARSADRARLGDRLLYDRCDDDQRVRSAGAWRRPAASLTREEKHRCHSRRRTYGRRSGAW